MIEIKFNNEELFERMHEALKGSKGYIDNEIILSKDANGHCLTVGCGENPTITITLNELEVYDYRIPSTEFRDILKVSETKNTTGRTPVLCINNIYKDNLL